MNSSNFSNYNAFKQLLSNKFSLIAVICIVLFFFISIFAYQIMPDNSPLANNIELSIAKKEPGFKVKFLLFKEDVMMQESIKKNTLFFGKDKPYQRIPINNYQIIRDSVYYSIYGKSNLDIKKTSVDKLYFNKSMKYVEEKLFSNQYYI